MSYFKETDDMTNGVDLMIDIETLGTAFNAPVISVGAVLFDPRRLDSFKYLYDRAFYAGIKIEDAMRFCAGISGGTIEWWFQQKDAAIKRLVSGDQIFLKDALDSLFRYSHARFTKQPEWHRDLPVPQHVWAKSPDFDCVILRNACDAVRTIFPFHFAKTRCVRTIQDLGFPDGELPAFEASDEAVVAHDARDDAVRQAMMVQRCYAALGLSYESGTEFVS